jgi:hypothetical protein
MKNIKLFSEYSKENYLHISEGLSEILYLAKNCGIKTPIASVLLSSDKLSDSDKLEIKKANPQATKIQDPTAIGVGKSMDFNFSKEISLSRALADLSSKASPNEQGTISYEIVSQTTVILQNNIYETTTIIKVSPTGQKITKGQLDIKKRAVAREDAKEKKSAHVADLNAELEARAKKFGFETVEEYFEWQRERSKGTDQPLDGLEDPKFNSGKRCGIARAGDRANRRDWKKK